MLLYQRLNPINDGYLDIMDNNKPTLLGHTVDGSEILHRSGG
jgi:hypothetical protein